MPAETDSASQEKTAKVKKAASSPKKSKSVLPWTFPKHPLETALAVAKAIEEQNGGNPMKADMLVKAVGLRKPTDWRFLDLLRSANQYGLVSGTGANATVKLETVGQDVVAPGSPSQRQQALLKAFRNVAEFQKVEEYYKGKRLPEDEFFENTLVRDFGIPRDRVTTFIDVFTKNLAFLKAFRADIPVRAPDDVTEKVSGMTRLDSIPEKAVKPDDAEKGRTFLDTCFVMMPFGTWFDTYYRELFTPAIKDAGLEPIRADELFSTGTVIEQIWDEIRRAKVLLADLTGKNANVFYELGLAHADHKPVVFTSGSVEDVPFDLRHLRVIIYDVQDPFWGEKLKRSLTAYLKNARSDPSRSIPHPFRTSEEKEEE